jgi:hypothetical protein
LLVFLVGCATPAPEEGGPNRFVGESVEGMTTAYGPEADRVTRDGERLYRWRYVGEQLAASRRGPPSAGVSASGRPVLDPGPRRLPTVVPADCLLEVSVDAGGVVTDWRAVGNACLQVLERPSLWREP